MTTNATQSADELLYPDPAAADMASAKAATKKLFSFKAAGHTVLCKPMSRATWQRIQAAQRDADSKEDVTEIIMLDTLLYPPRAKFEELLEDYPAAAEAIALDLIALAKGDDAKRGKRA